MAETTDTYTTYGAVGGLEEIARALSHLIPSDGDDGNGKMNPAWDEANRRAAKDIYENLHEYRERYNNSVVSKTARTSEFCYFLVKEGRRRRNEYLAGVNV